MNLPRTQSTRHFVSASILLFALLLPATQLYAQGGAGGASNALPSGEGKDIVAMMCSQCHALRMVTVLRDGPLGWKKTVDEMVLRGAQIDAQQAQTVIQYLSRNFAPGIQPMQSGVPIPELPPGPGLDLVKSHCTLCHDLGRVVGVQRTKQEWDETVNNMMSRAPNMATSDEVRAMAAYLSSQFGKRTEQRP